MAAIALSGENEPGTLVSQRIFSRALDSLSTLELAEFAALEQHLKGRPELGRCAERAVHIDSSVREARANWLVNIDHLHKRSALTRNRIRRVRTIADGVPT